ncbi:MAG TPA: tetratricopeptide repeat protein, partial [Burkholderiales bacterium]|nr:tetratricopeptide repeat protein [Burkholderiales bacterium]
ARRYAWAVWAGVAYSLAVLSKEHAILLPIVVFAAVAIVDAPRPFALRYAALFGVSCIPAGVLVIALSTWLIGNAYEPAFAGIASQIEAVFGLTAADLTWPLSVATQAGLFFRYAALWLWPDAGLMSIDMRIDFVNGLSTAWQVAKVTGFAGALAAGVILLRRGGARAVAGFGICYLAVLFLVEFSTLRFQEPFVLYRSYLWGPGMLLVIAAALYQLRARHAAVAALVIVPVVAFQANDRLQTFQHPLRLWEDAVSKLPSKTVPWGSRTLYNLGREYLYAGRPDDAIAVTETCIKRYPGTFQCVFGRASVSLHLGRYEEALSYMTQALALQPDEGVAHHHVGVILEKLGREQAAIEHYRRAYDLGFTAAELQLQRVRAAKAAYSSAVAR